ncbi:hypothetical protein [Streptomyces sp. NPDC021096]|uniref:hypothetical protein n=1 Tax=Streptomyces sp. NPDC021096 TaxID=3154792 RepID=UPI0033E1ACAD
MGENTSDAAKRSARARELHRMIERFKAGRAATGERAQSPLTGPAEGPRTGPGGPNLREAVQRRMRELDKAEDDKPARERE